MANTGKQNLEINPEIQDEGLKNPDRRTFLRNSVIATAGLATGILSMSAGKSEAQEVQLAAYNPETSPLGINYSEIAETPLDAMLREGEDEFIANATQKKGDRAIPLWKDSLVSSIVKERLTNRDISQLQKYTPNLLIAFINLPSSRYPLLQAIGRLQKVNGDLDRSNDILEKARALAGITTG